MVVIRYEGPRGGPGMREMLAPTSAIIGAGLGDCGRAHHGRAILGRDLRAGGRPRGAGGGGRRTIALLEEGDLITIDAERRLLEVDVSETR